jgi:hypothetical protein
MTDERQRPKRIDLTGHLMVAAIVAVLWACSWGLAHGQTFALQPGNDQALIPLGQRGSTRIDEKELKLVDGNTIRIRPQWISKNGKWDWSFPDSCVALCRKLNKQYTLLLMGGANNPTSTASLTFYDAAWKELGRRYAADPLCVGVHPGVPPAGYSEELFWGRPMPTHAMAANKRMTAVSVAAFPRQMIIIAGSANDPAAMRELIRYGVSIAPGRFVYKMNAMSPKPNLDWMGNTLLIDAAKLGADIGYEELQPSNHSKFGGTWVQFVAKVKEIERRAGERFVYQALYRYDLAKAGGLK